MQAAFFIFLFADTLYLLFSGTQNLHKMGKHSTHLLVKVRPSENTLPFTGRSHKVPPAGNRRKTRGENMRNKLYMPAALMLIASLTLAGCSGKTNFDAVEETGADTLETATYAEGTQEAYVAFSDDATTISLSGTQAAIDGSGAEMASEGKLYITKAGEYVLSGNLTGTVIVECENASDEVTLYLNGVTVSSDDYAAILCYSAGKVTVSVVEGTENSLSDGTEYSLTDDEDTADAALYSNCDLVINGTGSLTVTGNHKNGIDAEQSLEISGVSLEVNAVEDGIEGALINLNGGDILVVTEDDGINASSEDDDFACKLIINGGTIVVKATGDGLDANGSIEMNGGDVTVLGPSDDGNASIDYDDTFVLNGGTLKVAGNSGMAQYAADSSAQNSIIVYYDTTYESGTTITLKDADGNELLNFASETSFNFALLSCDALTNGETYTVITGSDELEITIDGVNTISGNARGMGGPGNGEGMGPDKNGTPPDGTDGERPEMPDGENAGGNLPEKPDGEGNEPPQGAGGERPEGGPGGQGQGPAPGSDSSSDSSN